MTAPLQPSVYRPSAKSERNDPDLNFASAAAKVFASDSAMSATTDAVQLFDALNQR